MKCPNCNKDMKEIVQREWCQTDPDEAEYYASEYRCKNCNIQYDVLHRKYNLPENLMPTERQERTLYFILNRIEQIKDDLPITKFQYCKFIGKYFDEAKSAEDYNSDLDDDLWNDYDVPINM